MDPQDPFEMGMLIIALITFLLQLLVLYLIVVISPKTMHDYRFYLIVATIIEILYSLNYSLVLLLKPPEIYPGVGIYCRGLASYLGQTAANIFASSHYFLCGLMIGSQHVCMIYRFLAIHPDRNLRQVFMTSEWKRRSYGFVFVCSLLLGIGLYFGIADPSEYAEIISTWTGVQQTIDYTEIRILLRNNRPYLARFFSVTGLLIVISEAVHLAVVISILWILKRKSASYSRRSLKMHRDLTVVLMLQLLIPALMLILPCILFLFKMQTKTSNSRIISEIWTLIIASHMCVISLITIIAVGPYRRYLLNLFWRLIRPSRLFHLQQPKIHVSNGVSLTA
ncbi:hypothetical protein M3Y95_00964200 [Aphelenchoides besseyi]|nr:hypothetical protein M3Y95_00964200 [Aphelenchoides besseyi]